MSFFPEGSPPEGLPQVPPEKTPAPQTHRRLLYSRSMPPLQPVDASFTAGRCLFLLKEMCVSFERPWDIPRYPPGAPGENAGAPNAPAPQTHRRLLYSRSMPSLQPVDVFFFPSLCVSPLNPGTPQVPPEKTPAPQTHRRILYSPKKNARLFEPGQCRPEGLHVGG